MVHQHVRVPTCDLLHYFVLRARFPTAPHVRSHRRIRRHQIDVVTHLVLFSIFCSLAMAGHPGYMMEVDPGATYAGTTIAVSSMAPARRRGIASVSSLLRKVPAVLCALRTNVAFASLQSAIVLTTAGPPLYSRWRTSSGAFNEPIICDSGVV